MKLSIFIPVGCVSMSRRVVVTRINEPSPNAYQCDCGRYIAGWLSGKTTKYNAFSEILRDAANRAMEKAAVSSPFVGPLELTIILQTQRPKTHFIGGEQSRGIRPDRQDDLPTSGPNPIGCIESVRMILEGIVYHDRKQIIYPSAVPLYSDTDGTLIMIRQINAGMIDPRNKQLELF